jgi:hypothetical protein
VQTYADATGRWTADFEGDFDVLPRMGGTVHLADDDGDTTRAGIPARFPPVSR